jgi:nucleoside-diphosphate-sugar epimerase
VRRTVLVTGATGCLGSNLTRRLVELGERVAILTLHDTPPPLLTAFWNRLDRRIGDVTDRQSLDAALEGVTHVYHLAGIAAPINRLRPSMLATNVTGTANVAGAALARRVERLVFTSSSSAVGIPPDGSLADEQFAYNGDAFDFAYMHTKRLAEEAVLDHVRRGLDAVVVNPTAVMAPGGDRRFNWTGVVDAIRKRRMPFVPSGGVGVVTCSDMVEGHMRAMERGRTGHRYLLNTVNITYGDLARQIAGVVGVGSPIGTAPDWMLLTLASGLTMANVLRRNPYDEFLLTREHARLLVRRVYYDQSKAVTELGLPQTPLSTAIAEVHQWLATQTRPVPSTAMVRSTGGG